MRRESVLFILALLLGSVAGSSRAELVGHWKLDEGAGVVANDASGHGNHGTLKGNPKWAAGSLGQALDLDGVDDFVEIPHADSLTVDKNVTVSAWIRATQYLGATGADYQGIVAKSNGPRSYSLYLNGSGSLHFSTNGIGTMSTTKVPLNEWAHVAAQVVDGTQKYFINGVAAGVDGSGITLPGAGDQANVVIGKTWEASREFYGKIDDVRIYNHALDLAGVKESMKDIPFAPAMIVAPTNGSVIGQIQYTLKWEPGDFATSHAVYFGESLEAVEARQVAPVTTTTASLDVRQIPGYTGGLTPGKTYYWCVDEVAEGSPASPWEGPVWSFMVQPWKSWNPAPSNGGQFVLTNSPLTWNSGLAVIFHTVYLGTSLDAVANGTAAKRMVVQPTFTPDKPLEPGTTYYWRVDEFSTGNTTHIGDIWSFTTLPPTPVTDPHLLGWWKLDEGVGSTAVDWSGSGNHGTIVGNPAWVDGYYGSALLLSAGKYVNCGTAAGASIKGDFTLASWTRLSPGNAGLYGGIGGKLVQATNYFGFSLVRHSSNVYRLWVADGTATLGGMASSNSAYTDTEWRHVAGVRQGQANVLFVDGVRQDASNNTGFAPSTEWFHIGRQYSHLDDRYFPGVIDDVRIYDVASTDAQIATIMRGDPTVAVGPEPANGSVVDIRNVSDLTWESSDTAVSHDVYFGTSRQAVAKADRSSPEFKGNQVETGFALADMVDFGGGLYAWRIDEVAADGSVRKGYVWTFTVPEYLIVDDFESYTDIEGNRIYEAWEDGMTNKLSTSVVGYAQAPFAEQKIVNGGRQSMPMDYDNTASPFFAEAELAFSAQDWTEQGVAALSLAIRGNLDNVAGTLYVGLQDSAGKLVYVSNPDASILTSAAWTQWKIPLSQFGVKAAAIKKIVVGVGNRTAPAAGGKGRIYIDDICLVRS